MGLGASLFLIAGGAILVWGVNREVAGLDVDAIGVILMVIGIVGAVLSMIFWSSWGGSEAAAVERRRTSRKGHARPRLTRRASVLRGQGQAAAVRHCALRCRLGLQHLQASPMATPWASALSAG